MESTLDRGRKDLLQRLKYTIQVSDYLDIEEILKTLVMKENVKEVYQDLFEGCQVDSKGRFLPGPFFDPGYPSAALDYAAYNLLGWAPDSFQLKHQVRRIEIRQSYGTEPDYAMASGIFRLPNLEVLILSGLGISQLPIPHLNCPSLGYLDLSRNNLTHIPRAFWKFSRLKKLHLGNNRLDSLELSLKGLSMLQSLDLSGNQLKDFPKGLERFSRLEEVNLQGNRLAEVPEILKQSRSLKNLSLSYNRLKAAEEAYWEEGGAMGACQMDLPL